MLATIFARPVIIEESVGPCIGTLRGADIAPISIGRVLAHYAVDKGTIKKIQKGKIKDASQSISVCLASDRSGSDGASSHYRELVSAAFRQRSRSPSRSRRILSRRILVRSFKLTLPAGTSIATASVQVLT